MVLLLGKTIHFISKSKKLLYCFFAAYNLQEPPPLVHRDERGETSKNFPKKNYFFKKIIFVRICLGPDVGQKRAGDSKAGQHGRVSKTYFLQNHCLYYGFFF